MSYETSAYVGYGAKLRVPDDMHPWSLSELKPLDEKILLVTAGEYDNNDAFLVIPDTWKEVEPGDPTVITPYQAAAEPYLSWDALIVAAAEEVKLPIDGQLGWLFIPDMA